MKALLEEARGGLTDRRVFAVGKSLLCLQWGMQCIDCIICGLYDDVRNYDAHGWTTFHPPALLGRSFVNMTINDSSQLTVSCIIV